MTSRFLAGTLLLLAASAGFAQAPHDDWRTITTDHYRVHYPRDYEEWAHHAARKLESIRAVVVPLIGYEPTETTDVIVADPFATPNGSAWPFLGSPRMVLWASPPGPGGMISNQSDWAELVAIHEDAHLVHLLRPSRNVWRQVAWYLLPVRTGPVVGAPRWAIEGYATVIEGQLTGKGRPHSDLRASILRRWAQEGRMPTYRSLAADSSSWLGGSMAYLVGSAYLEWLLEREGEESLRNVWARLTAKRPRDFDEAFGGVFGESPQRLYQRFVAELTQRAMAVEAGLEGSSREGELFQDFDWFTDRPDVSPDGSQLVTVRRRKDGPARLVVLGTGPDNEAEEKWQKRIDELLAKDPDDVAPIRRKPLTRKPKYHLERRSGAVPRTPRWIAETGHVLFVEWVPDSGGFFHPDLFRWNPKTDEVRRLTVAADLSDADSLSLGASAVAVRNRFGASQLVRIDFSTAEVEPITPASVHEVYGNPRVSPDETMLAYIVLREGNWRLVVRDLTSGEESSRTFDGTVSHPAWSSDGSKVFASVGRGGFVEIQEFAVRNGEIADGVSIARSSAALFGPAAGKDELFFLAMDADGIEMRRLGLDPGGAPLPDLDFDSTLAPAVRVVSGTAPSAIASEPLGEDRPYGMGRLELSPLIGGSWAASGSTVELAGRLGDVIGRTEFLALGSLGNNGGPSGAVISGVTRRWPIEVSLRAFSIDEKPSEQRNGEGFVPVVADRERTGTELELAKTLHWRTTQLRMYAGGYWNSIDTVRSPNADQWGGFAGVRYVSKPTARSWSYPQSGSLDVASGATDDTSFTRVVAQFSFGVLRKDNGLEVALARGAVDDDVHPADRFEVGGLPASLHGGVGVFSNRVWAPGLPFGTLEGSTYTRLRGSVIVSFVPMKIFYERIETSTDLDDDSIDYVGMEFNLSMDSMPVVKIPNVTVTAGVSVALDPPVEDEVKGWIGLRWGR